MREDLRFDSYVAVYSVYTDTRRCSANRDITRELNFIVNDIFCSYGQQSATVTATAKKKKNRKKDFIEWINGLTCGFSDKSRLTAARY